MDSKTNKPNTTYWPFSIWASKESSGMQALANHQILKINNELTGIFSEEKKEFKKLELPRLVVVGTQSSGKSSVLNSIIAMDFLPMGKTMVTRTPLDIRLTQTKDDMTGKGRAEFGDYSAGTWTIAKTYAITVPEPTKEELDAIRKEIEHQTNIIAGDKKAISATPIIIKIFSPFVPNLSLIDLPGLTMLACTDKGQPADIKKQISDLITHYISQERTIILAVMPARPDLDADPALALAKEVDPNGKRTLGILTKIDLMDKETDISDYLMDNVSLSVCLKLNYGYHAVINRSASEAETTSIQTGFQKEKAYFQNHNIYSKLEKQNKLGVPNLSISLSNILVEHIRKLLPDITKELATMQMQIDKSLVLLGKPLPVDTESRYSIVNLLISDFCKNFVGSLEDRGAVINTGRKVKDIFIGFRKEIDAINAFKTSDDAYFMNIIKNCEGNHMSGPTPPIEVLELCMRDPNKQPLKYLKNPSINCANVICAELQLLIDKLLALDKIARFPKLVKKIREEVINKILVNQQNLIYSKIDEIILMEENYIWTDESVFLQELGKLFNGNSKVLEPQIMRCLLTTYFDTVKKSIQNSVPKAIMYFLIKKMEDNVSAILFEKSSIGDVNVLLEEASEQATKRSVLEQQKLKIESARKAIDNT